MGAIAVTLAVGDELQVYNGGSGYTEANKDGEVTNVELPLITLMLTLVQTQLVTPPLINYEQIGESFVKATVAAITTNSFNAGDQITVDGNGASDEDARSDDPF